MDVAGQGEDGLGFEDKVADGFASGVSVGADGVEFCAPGRLVAYENQRPVAVDLGFQFFQSRGEFTFG